MEIINSECKKLENREKRLCNIRLDVVCEERERKKKGGEEERKIWECNPFLIRDARSPHNLPQSEWYTAPMNVIFGLRLMWVAQHTHAGPHPNKCEQTCDFTVCHMRVPL